MRNPKSEITGKLKHNAPTSLPGFTLPDTVSLGSTSPTRGQGTRPVKTMAEAEHQSHVPSLTDLCLDHYTDHLMELGHLEKLPELLVIGILARLLKRGGSS